MSQSHTEILYLCDRPEYVRQAAEWIYHEFIKDIKTDYSLDDIVKMMGDTHRDKLPIRLIALSDDKCVGTVSIMENDLRSRAYTPWLAALYVDPAYRALGIGQVLIAQVKDIVKKLGFREVFLRTELAAGYYQKLGWQFVEQCKDDYNLVPYVFKWEL